MADNKSFGLSIDVKGFVRYLLTDPTSVEQVMEALEEGPADQLTLPLGACNLGSFEQQEWFTLFMANSKEVAVGESGHLIRPKSEKTKGRVILNLREQNKEQLASRTLGEKMSSPKEALEAATPGLTDEQRNTLLARLQSPTKAKAEPQVPVEAVAALQG